MRRRDLDYLVIVLMLASGLYVTVTGLIADLFGLHQFTFHSYAGYLCAGFILLHVALNWRRATAYLGRLLRRWRRGIGGSRGTKPPSRTGTERQREEEPAVGRREVLIASLSAAGGFVLGWLLPGRRPDLPGEATDVGMLYHQWSMPGHLLDLPVPDWGRRPPKYKTYPNAERIALPDPRSVGGLSTQRALEDRRSVRTYSGEPLSMEALSRLLHAAQGITEERLAFRSAPSAGALYPVEVYPIVHNVSGLPSGLYHYAVREHALEQLRQDDLRGAITQAGLYQSFLGQANVCFVLSALFQRTRWKYRERAYRYVLLEVGHIGQNLYLEATSMGLGACAVGAFLDDPLNNLLEVDGLEEAALYVVSVGEMD